MEASGADRHEMDVDLPAGNQSNQQANTRTLRSAVVQIFNERDGRSASVSSTTSASRSRSEGFVPRVNYVLVNRSPPPTTSRRGRRQGESSGQHPSNQVLREGDIARRGVRARANNPPVSQANTTPAVQTNVPPTGNNPLVMPIDLTVRERLQELERENKRLKVSLEKRRELEAPANSRSGSGRTNRHRGPDSPRRRNEVIDDRWRSSPNDDYYYGVERGSQAGTSRRRKGLRIDQTNDGYSKRSRRERDHSKRRTDLVRNERIRKETEDDSEKDEVLSRKKLSAMIDELLTQKQSRDEEQQILSMKKSMDSPFVGKIRRFRPASVQRIF
ncbi:uncharacterized protein LOC113306067 [Papaver somniferum]|uniref:uncharacterized protein LOC113306067 n=1 Tax=Papaver somniferum TaxID=3469 RepID=UPI000E6FCA56|nr:uncharacterized protein LOC113306067 [Papaver somniferum]